MFSYEIEYNPEIIQEFAKRLYRQANGVIISYTIVGLLIGLLVGFVFMALTRGRATEIPIVFSISCFVFSLIGFLRGREKAMWLKLKAQLALCQIEIEKNTKIFSNLSA